MKFCLSSRQTPEYLRQADEIKVTSRDYKQIYDLVEEYPNKTIILNYQDVPEEAIKEFTQLAPDHLILSLFKTEDMRFAKKMEIPYYFSWPINTLEQLKTVKNLGVCYALLDNEVAHQLHYTKYIGVPLRMIPNLSHMDDYPREDGVCGSWFRPEDVDAYSIYVDTIEFGLQPQKREQALFRIYAKQKYWPGDLKMLVQDLNYVGTNLTIDNNAVLRRMNCGMTCAYDNCSLCYDIMKISHAISKAAEENKIIEDKEENNNES